jgi:DNA-binding transcriptional LysR family regulator
MESYMSAPETARRRLKLRQLEILLAVADTGSMAKAAVKLAVTQPAISRAIADAELTLGVPLFERSTQGVNPTQYGHALLKRGIAAFDELDQGVKDIRFLADPASGELRIGTPAGISDGIVLAVLNKLSRQYPRVGFQVAIAADIALLDQLRERKFEIGFERSSGMVGDEDVAAEVLYEEPLIVVAGVDNPWVQRRKIKLAELLNEPWTWPLPGSSYDSLVQKAFRASGLEPPRPAIYAGLHNLRISLAATGPFLAVVAAGTLSTPSKYPSIRKLGVELPTTLQAVYLLTLKKRTLSPLAKIFIDCAHDIAKPLAKRK